MTGSNNFRGDQVPAGNEWRAASSSTISTSTAAVTDVSDRSATTPPQPHERRGQPSLLTEAGVGHLAFATTTAPLHQRLLESRAELGYFRSRRSLVSGSRSSTAAEASFLPYTSHSFRRRPVSHERLQILLNQALLITAEDYPHLDASGPAESCTDTEFPSKS